MPRSVICSPSHITSTEPVVSVRTVISRKPHPGLSTICRPPVCAMFSRKMAMLSDCTTLSRIVP
ncbi:hypothetical protein D3C83_165300 [compost metagenome]